MINHVSAACDEVTKVLILDRVVLTHVDQLDLVLVIDAKFLVETTVGIVAVIRLS